MKSSGTECDCSTAWFGPNCSIPLKDVYPVGFEAWRIIFACFYIIMLLISTYEVLKTRTRWALLKGGVMKYKNKRSLTSKKVITLLVFLLTLTKSVWFVVDPFNLNGLVHSKIDKLLNESTFSIIFSMYMTVIFIWYGLAENIYMRSNESVPLPKFILILKHCGLPRAVLFYSLQLISSSLKNYQKTELLFFLEITNLFLISALGLLLLEFLYMSWFLYQTLEKEKSIMLTKEMKDKESLRAIDEQQSKKNHRDRRSARAMSILVMDNSRPRVHTASIIEFDSNTHRMPESNLKPVAEQQDESSKLSIPSVSKIGLSELPRPRTPTSISKQASELPKQMREKKSEKEERQYLNHVRNVLNHEIYLDFSEDEDSIPEEGLIAEDRIEVNVMGRKKVAIFEDKESMFNLKATFGFETLRRNNLKRAKKYRKLIKTQRVSEKNMKEEELIGGYQAESGRKLAPITKEEIASVNLGPNIFSLLGGTYSETAQPRFREFRDKNEKEVFQRIFTMVLSTLLLLVFYCIIFALIYIWSIDQPHLTMVMLYLFECVQGITSIALLLVLKKIKSEFANNLQAIFILNSVPSSRDDFRVKIPESLSSAQSNSLFKDLNN